MASDTHNMDSTSNIPDDLFEFSPEKPWKKKRSPLIPALLAVLGVVIGSYLTHSSNHTNLSLTPGALQGKWKLISIDGSAVGLNSTSGVYSQSITFHGYEVDGKTQILTNTISGTKRLPFPDKSVESSSLSRDGRLIVVEWQARWKKLSGNRTAITAGAFTHNISFKLLPDSLQFIAGNDLILNIPGKAEYARVSAAKKVS